MHQVIVTATIEARTGKESELRHLLTSLVSPTRREPGCLNYDLHVATESPALFLFHETWTTKEALDTHLQSAHLQAVLPRATELCANPPQIKLWEGIA